MAGVREEIDLDRFADWMRRRNGQLKRTDFTKPLKQCRLLIASETKKNFDEGHSPDGTIWAPLKGPRSHGRGGTKPLVDRGILMASTTAAEGGGRGSVNVLLPDQLIFGTNLEYAAVHNYGFAPRNIPQRQFAGINDRTLEKIDNIFGDFLESQLGSK